MSKPRILALAGSTRRDSFNRRLIAAAAEAAREAGGEVTLVELKDYPLPLFDQDLEKDEGPPENARKLKALFLAHDALLIASPEYNSSISPLLKNLIDWVSRPEPGEPRLAAYQGKAASLLAASPGALGGLRGLVYLRSILGNIGVVVLPEQFALSQAHAAFDDDGSLKDESQHEKVAAVARRLVEFTARHKT
ncbi:MAG: NAD(P)H-dependent oxidoreductase [Pirellulaceae bacterium]